MKPSVLGRQFQIMYIITAVASIINLLRIADSVAPAYQYQLLPKSALCLKKCDSSVLRMLSHIRKYVLNDLRSSEQISSLDIRMKNNFVNNGHNCLRDTSAFKIV